MTRLTVRARVAIASTVLALAVLIGLSVVVDAALRRALESEALRQADSDAARLAALVQRRAGTTGPLVPLSDARLVQQLARPDAPTLVLDDEGRVVRASPSAPRKLAQVFVQRCLATGRAATERGANFLVCLHVTSPAGPGGAIVAGASLAAAERTQSRMRRALAGALVAGCLLILVLAWLTTRRALRPLARIAVAARRIGLGEGPPTTGYDGPRDEIGVLAAELDDSFRRLAHAREAQARFLADAAHELRSPLAAARSHVELLRGWAAADAPVRDEALAALQRSTARMTRLVDDLLHAAHGDRGPAYGRAPVSLDDLLLELHRETRAVADGVRVELRIDDCATVVGDRDKLHQLVRNLVDNALRHSRPGEALTLGLECHGEHAVLMIADTGCGIPAYELSSIFERHHRAGSPARSGIAGLGLAIARDIAVAHAGDINVQSEVGCGTTVRVRLPLAGVADRPGGVVAEEPFGGEERPVPTIAPASRA